MAAVTTQEIQLQIQALEYCLGHQRTVPHNCIQSNLDLLVCSANSQFFCPLADTPLIASLHHTLPVPNCKPRAIDWKQVKQGVVFVAIRFAGKSAIASSRLASLSPLLIPAGTLGGTRVHVHLETLFTSAVCHVVS